MVPQRRSDLLGRDRGGVDLADLAVASRSRDSLREGLVDEVARIRLCPEPGLVPAALVRRPDDAARLWQMPDCLIEHVPELRTDVREYITRANKPIQFTKHLVRSLGEPRDVRRRPVRSPSWWPAALLAPGDRTGSPEVLGVRHNDGPVREFNLIARPIVHDGSRGGNRAGCAVLIEDLVAYLDCAH